jgi:hypothetical protein
MRNRSLAHGGLLIFAAGLVFTLTAPISGRWTELASRRADEFQDWSTRHVVHAQVGPMAAMVAIRQDPRAIFSWRKRFPRPISDPDRDKNRTRLELHRDWIINLGTAGTAPSMYPAKYTFNVNATPSCANDYVIFPVNAKGTSSQPNIVAFNNLYSGTSGGTGICNRTPSTTDNGTSATVSWSYNVQAVSGGAAVPISPVISYDPSGGPISGAKVAFIESAAGSPAHFHVLAWRSTDGQNAGNLQSVLTPKTINIFSAGAPGVGSGTASDLILGSSTLGTVTLSSPFVDYSRDLAYVGNDLGVLYRIKDVFCITSNPDCVGTSKPAPSLDTTWGTGGAVTVCSGVLTAPVLDYVSLNVFLGCSDGKLYSVSQSGVVKSITVGDGVTSETYGAIVDPPVVDSVNSYVYAVSGSANNGANGVVVQATVNFSSSVAVPVGAGNQCNMHAPAFDNAYYTSPTAAGALIYVAGVSGAVSQPCSASSTTSGDIEVYGVTFGAGGVMTSGTPADSVDLGGGPGAEWAPLLEFYNSTTATDWLFVAALQSNQTNMASGNITSGFPTGASFGAFVTYGLGPSGMIVDNDANTSTYPQAASIYFNALQENAACNNNTVLTDTGGCAVKLTQAALQ